MLSITTGGTTKLLLDRFREKRLMLFEYTSDAEYQKDVAFLQAIKVEKGDDGTAGVPAFLDRPPPENESKNTKKPPAPG